MKNTLFFTNDQKILKYLVEYPEKEFLAGDIQKALKISNGGANIALRKLSKEGYVNRVQKGSIFLYSINYSNPIVKQLKVLKNIELINPIINKLKSYSKQIILFGSCARGEDLSDSDIDLFILTNDKDNIDKITAKNKLPKKLQVIIRTPVIFTEMKDKEPVFYEEVSRGIVLWETKQ
jgi:predicted nucleotidyltransferase